MEYVLVAPDTLRAHWACITTALDAVQAKAAEAKAAEDWIREDVYHAIKSGQVACHLLIERGQYAGLLIVRPQETEFSRSPTLHVWIAHSAGDASVFDAGEGLLKQTAQRMGVSSITFGSPRPGWAKRYPLISATYEIT